MNHQRSLGLSRSAILLGLLLLGACSKKAAQLAPTPSGSGSAAPPPAANAVPATTGGDGVAKGIDLGKLDDAKRKVFDEVANRESSACGKGHSLLYSLKNDSSCRASFYAVRYIARLAESGLPASEISEKVEQRFRAPHVPYIDVSQAPSKGSASGKVTLVEFADYECDHCKQAQPVIHALVAEYGKDLTVYFKHFPLGGHVNSVNAAMGAVAAQKQGKFWQFNDKVWENSGQLVPAMLEKIAKEIGLDFSRFYSDVGTEEVRGHVQRDRTEGRSLEIRRTPAIFINGRRFTDEIDLPSLRDWIDEELGR